MKRILKYTLHDHGATIIPLPVGAVVLHVADQQGSVQMWVQCETDNASQLEGRKFITLYTGFDEVPGRAVFIGTALSSGGSIVTHVFEVQREGQEP